MEEPKQESFREQHAKHVKWAREASEERLREEYFKNTLGLGDIAEKELRVRIGKHWTLTPGFFIACLTMVFAAIAAWPIVHDWIWRPVARTNVQSELALVPQKLETPSRLSAPTNATSSIPVHPTSSLSSTPTKEPQP